MAGAIPGMAFVMVIFVSLLQSLSLIQRRFAPHPEVTRKALHVVMGLVTVSFPWLFSESLPVVLLALVNAVLLTLLKFAPESLPWKQVTCKTGRRTYGEIFFPLAVGILFVLSKGNPVLYCTSMLILTLADAASAIVGIRFGKKQYLTADGAKTTEGSLAFFAIASGGSFLSLCILHPGYMLSSAIVCLILGGLTMLFEGIAWKGLDNLFIPLGAYLVLITHLGATVHELLIRAALLALILLLVVAFRRRTTLNGGAILGVALFSYYSWVVGGFSWMLLPLIAFLSYRRMLPQRFRHMRNKHSVFGVIAVASTGLLWMLCAVQFGPAQFLFPYALGFAANESMIGIAHMRFSHLNRPGAVSIIKCILKSWCFIVLPLLLLKSVDQHLVLDVLLAPFCIAVPTVAFYFIRPSGVQRFAANTGSSLNRWMRQAVFATAGSAIGLLPCFAAIH